MRENIREALGYEMTRKQFLQYMGTALLMVFGLNNLLSLLTGKNPTEFLTGLGHGHKSAKHGFGSSKFGV